MASGWVIKQIDKAIKEIWLNEIQSDYNNYLLLKEDALKCGFYHHLRSRIGDLLLENNLRLFPEYWFTKETQEIIKGDIWKFKNYMNTERLLRTQFYFTVIYEEECTWLNWMDGRSISNWADGRVTELVSGRIDGEQVFEVYSYNGMNTRIK